MAASEKTLIYGGDAHCALSSKVLRVMETPKDTNYVDLNELLGQTLGDTKVRFTEQNDTFQCVRLPPVEHPPSLARKCVHLNCLENGIKQGATETKTAASSEGPQIRHESHKDCLELLEEPEYQSTPQNLEEETKVQHTDLYLSGSDDEGSLVITDYCIHKLAGDESHYITTHEIQLSELDHDVDSDVETASTRDINNDHQVYSFVDYTSVDGDEPKGVQVESNKEQAHRNSALKCNQAESDPGDRIATADEKAPGCQAKGTGHIHLSIKATSRAVNKPSDDQGKHGGQHQHGVFTGGMSQCVLTDTKAEKICDRGKCLIALPGRLHFGAKYKGKDVTGYSSGTSSAVSELDDADNEVRNLTAKAFKSLAYPYLDSIHFSTSSESSASERSKGINRWSALVDLKYGNVNLSNGGGHNAVTHQKKISSNFQLAKRRESKGITELTLASRRAPPVESFALNGNLVNLKNASSTQKNEFIGKSGQGQGELIRLTETLNFRCNVKEGPSANDPRVKSGRTAEGSHSSDEVTNSRQTPHNKPPCNSEDAMEDVHKKSIFASSILKNVISKKMQFEQERMMERGEIIDPGSHEHEAHRDKAARAGLYTQSSDLSDTGSSDFSIVCLDELGDFVDSGSCDAKDSEGTIAVESETNIESQNCAAFEAKKGAANASRSALIRSQNSAFRSWRDERIEVRTERENEQTDSKLVKMSSLFVPSIQVVSDERKLEKPEPSADTNREVPSMNTLDVSGAGQQARASKSPDIQISLRSLRDNRSEPFSISKLLAFPNTACSAAGLTKTNDEPKCQALTAALKSDSSDRIPHFTVRDVRDKAKLQAPIHQVRDVRKLVKSSYHFVSLDNNSSDMEHKPSKPNPCHNLTSLPPIVIKCHSVKTNSNANQSEQLSDCSNDQPVEDIQEAGGSHPERFVDGIDNGSEEIKKPSDHMPLTNIKQEAIPELNIETKTTTRNQEKVCDPGEKRADPKMAALEKLQAAVKTMEQLYVFDNNEWKRKAKMQPVADSHVLSILSSAHQGCNEQEQEHTSSSLVTMRRDLFSNPEKLITAGQQTTQREQKETFIISHTPVIHDKQKDSKTQTHLGGTGKKISSLSHTQKSVVPVTTGSVKVTQMDSSSSASVSFKSTKNTKSAKQPLSLNITQSKPVTERKENVSSNVTKSNKPGFTPVQLMASVDSDNYLTIPVKSYATDVQQPHMVHSSNTKSPGESHQPLKQSSTVMETRSPDTPTAMIYHHPMPITMHAAQPQVICFSPTVQPSPVATDHFQSTQRKMLMDPTTGNYYLVDTPVQPATRRLYDPETGQYVDVPMPQYPPMTPVPVPISPLALSPGGYGHTYMFYPGYMPSTVIPARTIHSQLSMQSEGEAGDKYPARQQEDGAYTESPYYVPSGKSQPLSPGAVSKVPVISITSQQGPRIVAPPSFDGTTMSFVVEHR